MIRTFVAMGGVRRRCNFFVAHRADGTMRVNTSANERPSYAKFKQNYPTFGSRTKFEFMASVRGSGKVWNIKWHKKSRGPEKHFLSSRKHFQVERDRKQTSQQFIFFLLGSGIKSLSEEENLIV